MQSVCPLASNNSQDYLWMHRTELYIFSNCQKKITRGHWSMLTLSHWTQFHALEAKSTRHLSWAIHVTALSSPTCSIWIFSRSWPYPGTVATLHIFRSFHLYYCPNAFWIVSHSVPREYVANIFYFALAILKFPYIGIWFSSRERYRPPLSAPRRVLL